LTLEISVGPPQVAIHAGFLVLVTDPDGQVAWPSDKGLYYRDTRLLSAYAIYANGTQWQLLNSGAIAYFAARIFLTNGPFPSENGDVAGRTISLVVSRALDAGLHEDLHITNYGEREVCFNLEVSPRSDFADIFEVKQQRIVRRGRITSEWSDEERCLTTQYRNEGFRRGLRMRAITNGSVAYANGRITFDIRLARGESWHGALLYDLLDGDTIFPAQRGLEEEQNAQAQALHEFRASVTTLSSTNADFAKLYGQALEDMAALRLPVDCDGVMRIVPAAGLPWFVALFGRDSLIISMQTAFVHSDFARGTLDVLAHYQATERDDYRDAEPGKIMHELRQGELAYLKLIPHTPYYGTADATPLYLVTLHKAWKATGDRSLLERHRATAEGCLRWIDEYGDRDGNGFQEYGTRSGHGYENVGWKDSGTAVVNLDGSLVSNPKALCELQGYVFDAWMGMAEIFDVLGEPARAAALRDKAAALYEKFNEVFWSETEGFYAYCLDGDKKPVWTVASNAGQLLWSGIVPRERAARVAARLMQPDMWSGWGIRTLSSKNPSYNPYSYQNGAVWPHDNGLIAVGFKRYGLHTEAAAIAGTIARAGDFFALRQLPELYSGVQRNRTNFPVQYLGANVPQGWAAGSVFSLVRAMLGLDPDAPAGRLYLDPALPDWLPDLTLHNLRLGDQSSERARRIGRCCAGIRPPSYTGRLRPGRSESHRLLHEEPLEPRNPVDRGYAEVAGGAQDEVIGAK